MFIISVMICVIAVFEFLAGCERNTLYAVISSINLWFAICNSFGGSSTVLEITSTPDGFEKSIIVSEFDKLYLKLKDAIIY